MADLLIVDDDEDMVDSLVDLLLDEGHHIRVAHDGLEGMGRLREGPTDLILLDVEMPRLTGPEMAYRLFLQNAGDEKIPIILLSGQLGLEHVADMVGTPYFLAKPYALASLLDMLARALVERAPPHPCSPASADARA